MIEGTFPIAQLTMKRWKQLNRRIVRCERCPRLRRYCQSVARRRRRAFQDWRYWGRPVPNFGDPQAGLLIIGLAPAAHGANRTGRMFTGDRSGDWLFRALYRAGFATQPHATSRDDGLKLAGCAITAVIHCAPPGNKPRPDEIENCQPWLQQTIDLLPVKVFVALGQLAWRSTVWELRRRGWWEGPHPRFEHGVTIPLVDDRWLVASYHPSQQNTFTGRLTEPMFDAVFATAKKLLRASRS